MPYHKKYLKKNKFILLIAVLFFLTKFFILFFQENVWWDSAVYVGIGKHIFSYGGLGVWEASRPLIWPLILGFFWKLGFDVMFFRVIELFFASGCIYLTYLIARDIFNERTAVFSALFLAFTPTFYFFSTRLLSGIPSLFFALLSVYFFVHKRYFFTGVFSSLAFMTRFPELFVFVSIMLVFLFSYGKKSFFRDFLDMSLGFFIVLAPYLTFNHLAYGNAFYPFILQSFMTANTGFVFHEPFWFYFLGLLKENYLSVMAIFGFCFLAGDIFKNKKNFGKSLVLAAFLVFFIFFNAIKHKEMRFLILLFPFLYILAAYFLDHIIERIKKPAFYFFIFLILSAWFLQSFSSIYAMEYEDIHRENAYTEFRDYLEGGVEGNVWISNPVLALYMGRISESIYYPTFNTEKYNSLLSEIEHADHILVDTCDIPCEPVALNCPDEKKEFISLLRKEFNNVFYNRVNGCEQFIFSR